MAVLEDLDRLDGGEVGRARIMIFPGSSCREWLSFHTTAMTVRPIPGVTPLTEVGPLAVGTRALVARSSRTGNEQYPAFVPAKHRSTHKDVHLPW